MENITEIHKVVRMQRITDHRGLFNLYCSPYIQRLREYQRRKSRKIATEEDKDAFSEKASSITWQGVILNEIFTSWFPKQDQHNDNNG